MKNFVVSSGKIQVSDPCYDNGTIPDLQYEEPAKNGTWFAKVKRADVDGWGRRIFGLLVHHRGFSPVGQKFSKKKIKLSVDSGQMGVYDSSSFGGGRDCAFYDSCCRTTLTDKGYGYVKGGFVTTSGLGDGSYVGTVWKQRGKAVAVEIVFIPE